MACATTSHSLSCPHLVSHISYIPIQDRSHLFYSAHSHVCACTPENEYLAISPQSNLPPIYFIFLCFPGKPNLLPSSTATIIVSWLLSCHLQKRLRNYHRKMRSSILTLLCLVSISLGQNCGPQYGNQTCAPGNCCMQINSSP